MKEKKYTEQDLHEIVVKAVVFPGIKHPNTNNCAKFVNEWIKQKDVQAKTLSETVKAKQKQKELIIKMMKADEDLGMYGDRELIKEMVSKKLELHERVSNGENLIDVAKELGLTIKTP